MIAAIPFSSWPGGSIALVKNVWLKSVIVYYLIAGVLLTVKDARKAEYASDSLNRHNASVKGSWQDAQTVSFSPSKYATLLCASSE